MSTGVCGIWAMKAGDFTSREFDGTPAGLASAIAYCGSNGVVTVYPGSASLSIGTPPAGVLIVKWDAGVQTVYGSSGTFGRSISVKDFGATGDGITDDTLAIQGALDSPSAIGGEVMVPEGTYRVSNFLKVKTGVSLRGSGKNTSTIKALNSSADIIRLQGHSLSVSGLRIEGTQVAGASRGIRHLGVDGVGSSLLIHDVCIADCVIFGTSSWGIEMQAVATGPNSELYSNFIDRCSVLYAASGGSLLYGLGSSSPNLMCRGSTLDGPGYGTFLQVTGTMSGSPNRNFQRTDGGSNTQDRIIAGMEVWAPGIPSGTTVASVTDATHIVLSATCPVVGAGVVLTFINPSTIVAGTLSGSPNRNFQRTAGSNTTDGVVAGMVVTGIGVPAGTTVSSVTDATHLVLSATGLLVGGITLTFIDPTSAPSIMTRGAIHIDTITAATFSQCIFEPTDSTVVSMVTPQNVVFRDCKFTMFTPGGLTAPAPDSGNYFITTAGYGGGVVIDGCQLIRFGNSHGPRLLKTSNNHGIGGVVGNIVSNCMLGSNEAAASEDDVSLGFSADEIVVFNVSMSGFGGTRPFAVFGVTDIRQRVKVERGGMSLPFGAYNRGHISLGNYRMWKEEATGRLRKKAGHLGGWFSPPTSDDDGDALIAEHAPILLADTTTPSVAGGTFFLCSPAGVTNITNFTGGKPGQIIVIMPTNTNMLIATGLANIKLSAQSAPFGGAYGGTQYDTLVLVNDGTRWLEISRSPNT